MANPLRIVLAESALELVPKSLWSHPVILKSARKRGKKPSEILLDVSLHFQAMKDLPDRFKRGRPDIIHVALLNALESPLNKENLLRTYIHTYNDIVIFIRPDIRLPKNYNRFVGLMEQLFAEGKVPPKSDTPLMYLKNLKLKDLINSINVDHVILLDEKGERKRVAEIARRVKERKTAVIIGGFQEGEFNEETYEVANEVVSIYDKPLPTWIVVSRIIQAYEELLGII